MIEVGVGSILDAQVEAIVNPANCVGVMGAGLALEIRRKWPKVYEDFRYATTDGLIHIGHIHSSLTGQDQPRFVMHLPTKLHWRDPAKLRYVEAGLADMSRALAELRVESVALPALGCGLGGLDWADVEPLIRSMAHGSSIRWVIFQPREP